MGTIRTRTAQRADQAAVRDLLARGVRWEVVEDASAVRVFELHGRIVAIASGAARRVAAPRWAAEPVPVIADGWAGGDEIAWVGQLLVIAAGVSSREARMVHRLARTLAAHEVGARWVFVRVPLPTVDGLDAAGVVQQIAAGALACDPVRIPVEEGYWPIGVSADGDHAVLVRRNDEF